MPLLVGWASSGVTKHFLPCGHGKTPFNLALSTQTLSSRDSQPGYMLYLLPCIHPVALTNATAARVVAMQAAREYVSPFLFGPAGKKKWLFVDLSRLPIRDARCSEPAHCW
jgi:hypothetical protein